MTQAVEETMTLDGLINDVIDHLAETNQEYRSFIAGELDAEFTNDDDVLDGIRAVLMDQRPGMITSFASSILTPDFEYEGDGKVSIHRLSDDPAAPGL